MKFDDTYFSTDDRYSIGVETMSGRHYASIPVSDGIVDYEERYELTPNQYHEFLRDSGAAIEFVEAAVGMSATIYSCNNRAIIAGLQCKAEDR